MVGLHLLVLPQVFQDIPLRTDSDTAVMLDAVQRYGALRWLVGDWLLENGFYRPVSSLSIALDYALYGEAGWGFRLMNWLLMLLTAIGAWTLVRAYARLTGSPSAEWLALGVGVALSLQQIGLTGIAAKWSAWWFVWVVLVVCWGVVSGLWVFFGGCVRLRGGLGGGCSCVDLCADRFCL